MSVYAKIFYGDRNGHKITTPGRHDNDDCWNSDDIVIIQSTALPSWAMKVIGKNEVYVNTKLYRPT